MVDTHYKNYMKKLALGINAFWQGYEDQALEMIVQADLDLDSSVGKHISKRLHESLETWLKTWRDIILNFNSSPVLIMPSLPQSYLKIPHNPDESPIETSLSSSEIVKNKPRVNNKERLSMPEKNLGEDDIREISESCREEKITELIEMQQKIMASQAKTKSEDLAATKQHPLMYPKEIGRQDTVESVRSNRKNGSRHGSKKHRQKPQE